MIRNLIILISLLPLASQAGVSVVASIEPLFRLTSTIMQGAGRPDLLIKRTTSAHHFTFKPSHFRLLQNADLVIWIDRRFESGFQHLPKILPAGVTKLELLRALGLQQQDGHIWYSPVLLIRITQQIRDALIRVDPQNSETYLRNAGELTRALGSWLGKSEAEINAANPRYILDHDFLSHFENDMGIEPIAILHDTKGQTTSIRSLQNLEKKLDEQSETCILTNETTPSKLARNLARKYKLRIYTVGQANPATDDRPPTIQMLDRLRHVLTNC